MAERVFVGGWFSLCSRLLCPSCRYREVPRPSQKVLKLLLNKDPTPSLSVSGGVWFFRSKV
jgi:hypothetical protein